MGMDPYFTSTGRERPRAHIETRESDEMLLGRSDRRLGSMRCPFPADGNDASEWRKGFEAEERSWRP
jgi:hypothetical protein